MEEKAPSGDPSELAKALEVISTISRGLPAPAPASENARYSGYGPPNRVDEGVRLRDVWTAMKRGFCSRCPRCGQGKLFRAFLKVADHCSACGLDFTPHRADNLPAYLVIIIVGHIVVPLALSIETNFAPAVWLQLSIYLPLTLILSLALTQRPSES